MFLKSTKKSFAILTLVVFMMTLVPTAAFGAVSAVAATPSVNATGATATYTINFTTATALPNNGTITVVFPAGTNLAGVGNGDITSTTFDGTFTVAAAAQTLTITRVGGTATAAGAQVLTIVNVVNGTTNAAAVLSVETSADAGAVDSAAFAIKKANRFSSILETDKTSLAADGTATVKFTVYAHDVNYTIVTGAPIIIASSRGTADAFRNAADAGPLAGAPVGSAIPEPIYAVSTDATGKAEFKVKSAIAGATKIGIALKDAVGVVADPAAGTVYEHLMGVTGANPVSCELITIKDITFTSPVTKVIDVNDAPTASDSSVVAGTGAIGAPWASTTVNGNGIDTYTLVYKATATNNGPAANQEVTFTVSDSALRLTKTTAITDAGGMVSVKVSAAKPGTYYVKATAGEKAAANQYMTFANNEVFDVKLVSKNNQTVAKSAILYLEFQLLDSQGNQIDSPIAATGTAISGVISNLNISAIKRPTDAAMDEIIATSAGDGNSATAEYTFYPYNGGHFTMQVGAGELNTEGEYTIRVFLDNGKHADANFTVKKQGAITSLLLLYRQKAVPLNTAVGAPIVMRYDADGTARLLTAGEVAADFTFVASDVNKVSALTSTSGAFTSTSDKDYAGDLVITAIDKANNLTASATVVIVQQVNGFSLTPPADASAVNSNALLNVQFVDVDGKALSVSDATNVTYEFYVIDKPSGALISTSQPSTVKDDLKKYGTAALKIASTVAGDIKIQVVATITGGSSAGTYTKDATVSFGAAKAVIGAKTVTMFIGATGFVQDGTAKVNDVVPFIQDGRTFVAVRPVADAFGAEIGWNEAAQTVTLTRSDMTLTIIVGSDTITKVANGVTTTPTADVPAFIKDGRTVLPFRAVGEAFGATVSYDEAAQAVSFAQ